MKPSERQPLELSLSTAGAALALNANREIHRRLQGAEDRLADKITGFAGRMAFVRLHIVWFAVWIAVNLGVLGAALTFDLHPFGLLTLVVSLEAIFLSTFVMISQNRQAAAPEIRSELDYRTNIVAKRGIDLVMKALERLARQPGIEVVDLVDELAAVRETPRHDAGRASACGERQGVTPVCVITGFATARAFWSLLRFGTGKAVGR